MDKKGIVLGRQIFIDLWSLLGFSPRLCEDPRKLEDLWEGLVSHDVAFIVYEPGWFEKIPLSYRQKIKHLENPVWIPFPDMQDVAVE